jgi:dihydrofolate synthase/folylpolyglutamate synthase
VLTWHRDWGRLPLPLLGPHQALNAAIALAVLDTLDEQGLSIGPDSVRAGWSGLSIPARCELLGERPWLLVDGAHNAASAEALAETIRTCLPRGPRTLVFGTTREKDLHGQLRALLPLFDRCIATCYLENPRAVPPGEVAEAVADLTGPPVTTCPTPAEALEAARSLTPPDGLICVTGSLFLAAETRALITLHPLPWSEQAS